MIAKALDLMKKVEKIALVALMLLIVLSTFLQVLGRFTPLPFSSAFEEVSCSVFVWMTLIGSAVCVRTGGHICMDLLATFLPKHRRILMEVWQDVVTFMFSVVFFWLTIRLIPGVKKAGMVTASLNIPIYVHYYSMVIGFGLMAFWSLVGIICKLQGRRAANGEC